MTTQPTPARRTTRSHFKLQQARKIVVAAMLLLSFSGIAFAGGGGKLPFTKEYKHGINSAKANGQPYVLYFTADW